MISVDTEVLTHPQPYLEPQKAPYQTDLLWAEAMEQQARERLTESEAGKDHAGTHSALRV